VAPHRYPRGGVKQADFALTALFAGQFHWIDIKGGSVSPSFSRFDPKTAVNTRYFLPSRVGTVVPVAGSDSVVVLALEDGLYTLDCAARTLSSLLPMRKPDECTRMNDGKCDPSGRLWVSLVAVTKPPCRQSSPATVC
jgi:sugar lactone lactonase YvrE